MVINLNTKSNKKNFVEVKFTIGFGNNLFQYCFARLLAEYHGCNLIHPFLPGFCLEGDRLDKDQRKLDQPVIKITRKDRHRYLDFFTRDYSGFNFSIEGYFEDYRVYRPYLDKLRGWFPAPSTSYDSESLALHLRLQNRLVQENHFLNLIHPEALVNEIRKFSFSKLHIVTDLESWTTFTTNDIEIIHKEVRSGPNPGAKLVPVEHSLMYINDLVTALAPFNPVIHLGGSPTIKHTGGLRGGFMGSFEELRRFEKLIIHGSTFSWWAAVLGQAKSVGVFREWKHGREDDQPNLSETNYPGWYQWGEPNDLFYVRERLQQNKPKSWWIRSMKTRIIRVLLNPVRFLRMGGSRWNTRNYE